MSFPAGLQPNHQGDQPANRRPAEESGACGAGESAIIDAAGGASTRDRYDAMVTEREVDGADASRVR